MLSQRRFSEQRWHHSAMPLFLPSGQRIPRETTVSCAEVLNDQAAVRPLEVDGRSRRRRRDFKDGAQPVHSLARRDELPPIRQRDFNRRQARPIMIDDAIMMPPEGLITTR